jgi:hypothetical protein
LIQTYANKNNKDTQQHLSKGKVAGPPAMAGTFNGFIILV